MPRVCTVAAGAGALLLAMAAPRVVSSAAPFAVAGRAPARGAATAGAVDGSADAVGSPATESTRPPIVDRHDTTQIMPAPVQTLAEPEGAPIGTLTGRWATLRRMPTDQRERWALREDVDAGRVDPLALVAHIARASGAGPLPIPPGARYHPACSRLLGAGSAVFTFGLEMHPDGRAMLERAVATQHERRTGQQAMDAMDRMQRTLESGEQGAVVRRAEAFLRRRGYQPSNNSNDHQIQANVWVRVTPAGRERPDVTLLSMMSYPQCQTLMPSGPAMHLSVRQ
jgi:hypothetical protein